LFGLLCAQAVTGLFANDDITYQSYLYPLVGADLFEQITGIHTLFEPLLIALVTLHVGAIAALAAYSAAGAITALTPRYLERSNVRFTETAIPASHRVSSAFP
jgi:cytochrome b